MTKTFRLSVLLLLACGNRSVPASRIGARLFSDPRLSTSPFNVFSCSTCHSVTGGTPNNPDGTHVGPIMPGYDLQNVVYRRSWWGGYETKLIDAINYCFVQFMGGGSFATTDEQAQALYEYLDENSPDHTARPLPLTVVRDILNLPTNGNAERGRNIYERSCKTCHGLPHTGAGRLSSRVSIIPEDTQASFPQTARLVVIEKIRHGKFFNIGGIMPLYSLEAISDAEIVDILAYLPL